MTPIVKMMDKKIATAADDSTGAYARTLAALQALDDARIAQVATELFGENVHQRIMFICWVKTLQNRPNRNLNPRSYPVNLISEPGEGKSAIVYAMQPAMEKFLSQLAGEPMAFHVCVQTLAGVNDLSEILGIVHLDPVRGISKLFPHENLPSGDDPVFGLLFIDDYNRGDDRTIAGVMELVNTGRYNSYVLPAGFSVVAASNPQGKAHKVRTVDMAQFTRFVNLPVAPPRSQWIQNLAEQGIDKELIAYAVKFRDVAATASIANYLPEPRPVNKRNFALYGHLRGVLKHDEMAHNEVAFAMFGPNSMRDLSAMLDGLSPLDAHEILGVNKREKLAGIQGEEPTVAGPKAIARMRQFEKDRHSEITAVSVLYLVNHLNKEDTQLSDEQFDALGEFLLALPAETANLGLRKLVLEGTPRKGYYLPKLSQWRAAPGEPGGPLVKRMMEKLHELKQQLHHELGA
jgi:hypothetical protein